VHFKDDALPVLQPRYLRAANESRTGACRYTDIEQRPAGADAASPARAVAKLPASGSGLGLGAGLGCEPLGRRLWVGSASRRRTRWRLSDRRRDWHLFFDFRPRWQLGWFRGFGHSDLSKPFCFEPPSLAHNAKCKAQTGLSTTLLLDHESLARFRAFISLFLGSRHLLIAVSQEECGV
jgi:hypothetical protein